MPAGKVRVELLYACSLYRYPSFQAAVKPCNACKFNFWPLLNLNAFLPQGSPRAFEVTALIRGLFIVTSHAALSLTVDSAVNMRHLQAAKPKFGRYWCKFALTTGTEIGNSEDTSLSLLHKDKVGGWVGRFLYPVACSDMICPLNPGL